MLGEGGTPLAKLRVAVREFQAREERRVDPKELRAVIDVLDGEFSANARECARAGEHLVAGNITAASWIARSCGMSISSAADRVWVGEQLESMPRSRLRSAQGRSPFKPLLLSATCTGGWGSIETASAKKEWLALDTGSPCPSCA